jgi:hypothetical protein
MEGVWYEWICSMHGRDGKCVQNFGPKSQSEESYGGTEMWMRQQSLKDFKAEECELYSAGSGYEPDTGSHEHCKEPSDSMKVLNLLIS